MNRACFRNHLIGFVAALFVLLAIPVFAHADCQHTVTLPASGQIRNGYYYLSNDVVLTGSITVQGNCSLCLNGYALDCSAYGITIGSGASLTVKDCYGGGMILLKNRGNSAITVNSGGTLNFESGGIQLVDNTDRGAGQGQGINNQDGLVNVTGGTFIAEVAPSNSSSINSTMAIVYAAGGETNITGGVFNAAVNVNTSSGSARAIGAWATKGKLSITGGSFSGNNYNSTIQFQRCPFPILVQGDQFYLGGSPVINGVVGIYSFYGGYHCIHACANGVDYSGNDVLLSCLSGSYTHHTVLVYDVKRGINDNFGLHNESGTLELFGDHLVYQSDYMTGCSGRWDEGVLTLQPTCTQNGIKTFTCKVCYTKKSETVPPLGHDWEEPTYVWEEDFSAVTASRVCRNDNAHIETEKVATLREETPSTQTNPGTIVYTAEFENTGFAVQTRTVELPLVINDGTCGNSLTWTLYENGELVIRGTGEMSNYEVGTAPWYLNRTQITSLKIEENVTSIGAYAFYYCDKIESVEIPGTVYSIGNYAFDKCEGITELLIPSGTGYIGNYAFQNCAGITKVTVPNSVTRIGSGAFLFCEGLTGVFIDDLEAWCGIDFGSEGSGNPLQYAHDLYLNGVLVQELSIPSSITSVKTGAFCGCSLTGVEFHDGVTSINDYAFINCKNLTLVSIPASVTRIGVFAFGQSGIQSVTIPGGIAIIERYAFAGCEQLTEVTFQNGVSEIGYRAFRRCTSLKSIDMPESISKIGQEAFLECAALEEILLPYGLRTIDRSAFQLCTALDNVHIPDSVTEIGDSAFASCRGLKSIILSENITSISTYMFGGCSELAEITIPDGVTNIYGYAFMNCANLKEIKLPDGLLSLGESTFDNCSTLERIVIPEGISKISNSCFRGCSKLKIVTMPEEITVIEDNAFNSCSLLADVYFRGSKAQWFEISVGSGNTYLTNATFHYGEFAISYDANGGMYPPESQNKTVGSDIVLATVVPDHEELIETFQVVLNANGGNVSPRRLTASRVTTFSFSGWNTMQDGSGKTYNPGDTYSEDKDLTLYAQWSAEVEESPASLPTPTYEDYAFMGWTPDMESAERINGYYMPDKDTTLIAIWKRIYIISFDGNGGSGSMIQQTVLEDDTVTLNSNTFRYGDKAFTGWNTREDGTGTSYLDKETIAGSDIDNNITLFSQWLSPDYILPTELSEIENEAFAGVSAVYVKLPESVLSIGWHAFADCSKLIYIYIPEATKTIDPQAFGEHKKVTILGIPGSTAESFASENGFAFRVAN